MEHIEGPMVTRIETVKKEEFEHYKEEKKQEFESYQMEKAKEIGSFRELTMQRLNCFARRIVDQEERVRTCEVMTMVALIASGIAMFVSILF